MTSSVITEAIRTKLRTAFLSPDLHLGRGLGSVTGEHCTIAEINFVLTGTLTDDSNPCISEVIRKWVIRVQDRMPYKIRNSVAWREAAVGIADSAANDEIEQRRSTLILDWMWEALGDDAVLAEIPEVVRPAWERMLTERTYGAARAAARAAADAAAIAARAVADYAAYEAANAAAAAAAVAAAYSAANAADYAAKAVARVVTDKDAYWDRRNPAKLLVNLIKA